MWPLRRTGWSSGPARLEGMGQQWRSSRRRSSGCQCPATCSTKLPSLECRHGGAFKSKLSLQWKQERMLGCRTGGTDLEGEGQISHAIIPCVHSLSLSAFLHRRPVHRSSHINAAQGYCGTVANHPGLLTWNARYISRSSLTKLP